MNGERPSASASSSHAADEGSAGFQRAALPAPASEGRTHAAGAVIAPIEALDHLQPQPG
jgi:hypothetical protein